MANLTGCFAYLTGCFAYLTGCFAYLTGFFAQPTGFFAQPYRLLRLPYRLLGPQIKNKKLSLLGNIIQECHTLHPELIGLLGHTCLMLNLKLSWTLHM